MISPLTETRHPGTAVHAIARASGAPLIPEVDRVSEGMPSGLEAGGPTAPVVASATSTQPLAPPAHVETSPFVESAKLPDVPEELDPLQRWALWRSDPGALALISLIAGGLFLLVKAAPALVHSTPEAALEGLAMPLGFMAICLAIGVGSVYLIAQLFETKPDSFALVVLRMLAVNCILDLTIAGVGNVNDGVVTTAISVPLGVLLARWMFKFDLAQMTVALVINLAARLLLVGLMFGWA
jgi:hypothetical protein